MKRPAIAIAAIALIGTPAFAADMAVKAPAPAPASVYNWTGWYVGVNAGASFGSVKTDFGAISVTTINPALSFTAPGFASHTEYPAGFTGGGQIGYNWQVSPIWVVGLEADFQGALERDSTILTNNFSGSTTGSLALLVTGSSVLNYQTKIDWFGTVRGRIGYLWGNGNVLSYLTGGLAYGKVEVSGTDTISGTVNGPPSPFSSTQAIGHSQVNTGWVVGYGTEGVIDFWGARNWTWKVESLYMRLGSLDDQDLGCGEDCKIFVGHTTTHTRFYDGILRGGLNYKFY
jgi:outer membrane immunogenic protein